MKTTVKKIDAHKRELSIEASGDIIKNKFDEVYAKIAEEAKIPGFRPGKAPRSILEKHHSGLAFERVLNYLIPQLCDEAAKSEKLEVIHLSKVEEVNLANDVLTFKATVEVKPQIPLKDYKGINLSYKRIEVTDEDLKKAKDSIKESMKAENLDDNFAKGLGYPDLQALDEFLRHNIYLQKESQGRSLMENTIVDKLLKDTDLSVPESLVERQLKDLLSHTKVDLAMKGLSKEQIEKEEDNISKKLRPEAETQVKVYLVLEEIAKRQNLPLDNNMPRRVMELLLREAKWEIS